MGRRVLRFATYEEVIADIDGLERGGYERTGAWSLGQVCVHLSYYMRGSLEGYPKMLPWVVRKLIGRALLRRVLRKGEMRAGGGTIPDSVPPGDVDEQRATAEAKDLLGRLARMTDPPHPSPTRGATP